MAFDLGGGNGFKSDINVTPLVDVMLVLLIIFMLVTPLLHATTAVDLPRAENLRQASDDPDVAIVVAIRADGGVLMAGEPVDVGALAEVLRDVRAGDPEREFHLRADRRAPFVVVRQVVRAGRDAGFRYAGLVAEPVEEDERS